MGSVWLDSSVPGGWPVFPCLILLDAVDRVVML
jgi:hypothetical protein